MEHPNLSRVQSRSVAEGWLTPEIPSLAAAISARPAERDPACVRTGEGRVSRKEAPAHAGVWVSVSLADECSERKMPARLGSERQWIRATVLGKLGAKRIPFPCALGRCDLRKRPRGGHES